MMFSYNRAIKDLLCQWWTCFRGSFRETFLSPVWMRNPHPMEKWYRGTVMWPKGTLGWKCEPGPAARFETEAVCCRCRSFTQMERTYRKLYSTLILWFFFWGVFLQGRLASTCPPNELTLSFASFFSSQNQTTKGFLPIVPSLIINARRNACLSECYFLVNTNLTQRVMLSEWYSFDCCCP